MDIEMLQKLKLVSSQIAILDAKLSKFINDSSGIGPTVDFIVDRFDRPDASTLGAYWLTGYAWALRGGKVVPTVANTSMRSCRLFYAAQDGSQALYNSSGAVVNPVWNQVLASVDSYLMGTFGGSAPSAAKLLPSSFYGASSSGAAYASYRAKMTTKNYVVAVDFLVTDGTSSNTPGATSSTLGNSHATQVGMLMAVSGAFQVVMGYSASVPAMSATASAPPFNDGVNHAAGSTASVSTPSALVGEFVLGNLAGMSSANLILDANPTLSGIRGSGDNAAPVAPTASLSVPMTSLFKLGANRIMATTDGINLTVTLNGTQIYTGAPGYVVNANLVGICTDALSTLGFGGGITSFKAWVSSMPEPPDQSGHGTYDAANGCAWADKYHTATRDPAGKVTYTYNPAA